LLTPQTPNSVSHTTFHPSSIKTGSFCFSSSSLLNYGLRFSSTLSAFPHKTPQKLTKKTNFNSSLSNSIPTPSSKISHFHINPALLSSTTSNNHDLAPPPELSYQRKEDLYRAAQKWAADHGYAICIGRSTTQHGEDRTNYVCDKAGTAQPKAGDLLGKTQKVDVCPISNSLGTSTKNKVYSKSKSKNLIITIPLQKIDPIMLPIGD
jgi:hypothetical protein